MAAAGWPRKRHWTPPSPAWHRRFNVAAAGWPRKPVAGAKRTAGVEAASMWPRLVGRGNSRSSGRSSGNVSRFNVAAAGWPRKLAVKRAIERERESLQCGRGWLAAETEAYLPHSAESILLQCGRGWLAAETRVVPLVVVLLLAASMWPRLVGRGNRGHCEAGGGGAPASMWPRLVGRGNVGG